MANIAVRSETAHKPVPSAPAGWDPLRWMRSMLGWDPFQEMAPLLRRERMEFFPDFDVKETKEGYLFKADVPGVKPSDLDVSVSGNRLTISGKREEEREEKGETFYSCERSYGSFMRSFTLPEGADADKVTAELKDGVLTLSLGKKPEMRAKKIDIKTAPPAAKPH